MDIKSHTHGDANVLELSGRFDIHVAPQVSNWLERAASATPPLIVVSMAAVDFVDSTALATLVQGMKRCRQRGGELHLCGLQQQVYMIFELTRLDKAFTIFADESHAVESFRDV